MLLAIAFIISSLALGYALSSILTFRKSFSEELSVSAVLGFGVSALAAFAFSLFQSRLDWIAIAAVGFFSLLAFLLAARKRKLFLLKIDMRLTPSYGVAAALFAAIACFLLLVFSTSADGSIYSIANAWGDYPLHFGIINSFAYGDNFPPAYPNLAGAAMRYPFLFDFLSAILVVGGFGLQEAVLFPNILLAFALVILARRVALEFTRNDYAAAAALLLFFLNGSLASLLFFSDISQAQDKAAFLAHPVNYAVPEGQPLELVNFVYSIFVPQRTVIMGFALALLAYLLLYRIYDGHAGRGEHALAGLAVGLLPLVHVASFAVVGLAAGFVMLNRIWKTHGLAVFKDPRLRILVVVGLLLALPQALWMNEQPRPESFFAFQPGWLARPPDLGNWALFWLRNAGIVLPLALVGLAAVDRKRRWAYLPFVIVFAAANLFRFQPWDWDNTKYFVHWLYFSAILAAIGMAWIWRRIARESRAIAALAVGAVLFLGIFPGLATFWYWPGTQARLFTPGDVQASMRVREETPADALILTAMRHNEPVYSLAGRHIVMGYAGHTWSHGLSDSNQSATVREAFGEGSFCGTPVQPDYVFVGPQELEDFPLVFERIANSGGQLERVFQEEFGGRPYALFKTSC
ncbi:MAG: hypothetical protein V1787_00115 [Candidatus Micrarchaeota archaeon]